MPPNASKSEFPEATTVSVGFSPRVEPKPAYPSAFAMIRIFCFDVFWQAGVWGTVLFWILFPGYQKAHSMLVVDREMSEPMFFMLMTR